PPAACRHAGPVAGALRRRGLPGRCGHRTDRRAAGPQPGPGSRYHWRPWSRATECSSRMMQERVLALAGLAQALKQVRRIAETGQADAAVLTTALESVFRIDAASADAVYGGVGSVRPGLRLLHGYFNNLPDDEQLPKLALAVLQLERRFINDGKMVQRVQRGITAARNEA